MSSSEFLVVHPKVEPWVALGVNSAAISFSVLAGTGAWAVSVKKKEQEFGYVMRVLATFITAFLGAFLPFAVAYLTTGYLPMGKRAAL